MKRTSAVLCLTLAHATAMVAQRDSGPQVTLYAGAHAGGVIAPAETDVQRTLIVDVAKRATLLITSPVELDAMLELPDGSRFSAADRPDDRRRWHRFRREKGDDALLLPGIGLGYNDQITLDDPRPGRYLVHLRRTRTAAAAEPAPFLITLLEDSEIRMGLSVPARDALTGAPFLVAALIFDGDRPVTGARVLATVTREPTDRVSAGVPAGEAVLADEGRGVDATSGDGIYTGTVTPTAAGRYFVAIHATGVSAGGVAFERHAGLSFEASKPTVRIAGVEQPSWQRRTARAPIDRLVIPVSVRGPAGAYEVLVQVRARNGSRIAAREPVTLSSAGTARAEVVIEASRLRTLAADGPYAIESLEVFEIRDEVRTLRARRVDRDKTPTVRISDLATN
jgi:hypothetical protein